MDLIIHAYAIPVPTRYKHMTLLKYLLTMKLFIVILILSFNVSANVYSQKIDLSVSNAPLREVMQQIRKQSGFNFFFATEILKDAKPVSVNLKQVNLEDALQAIFKDQPFSYQIQDKSILIKQKIKPAQSTFDKVMDVITISGKVTDEQGQPLPGASVRASGKAAVTDEKGEFTLAGVEEGASVEISYIGYTTKIVKAGSGEFLLIQMALKTGELNETVVKGYYTTTKELNTGSVGTLTAADIAKQPVSDPLMALEGRIPGLYLSQTSGVTGASINVNIRGINSISNGTSPFYIVDGIPFNSQSLSQTGNAALNSISPFTNIRPNDIESIDVLKDADATAIYGSRGANGVILIITKKGKSGKSKLDVNVYQGAGKISKKLDLMNLEQFLEMRKEAYKNDNSNPQAFAHDINGNWDQNRYTDWQKLMIGGTANITDAKASLSGGNAQTQFLLSIGYRKETTVFPGSFSDQIGSGSLNIRHQSENKKLLVNFSSNYSNNNNKLPLRDFTENIFTAPNAPALYDEKGQLNWDASRFSNPIAILFQPANSVTENLINNLTFSYNLPAGFQFKNSFGYNSIRLNEQTLIPLVSLRPSTYADGDPALYRNSSFGSASIKSWIIEPQINYEKTIASHHIDALVAATFQENKQVGTTTTANGFSNDELLENLGAAFRTSSLSNYSLYRYNAIFARIGYNYKEKYIMNLTGRRDGSSRFGPGEQFGNFGAIGAAWVFSKEKTVSDALPFLSLGKLRGSIGKTGNDQISDYRYLSTYSANYGYLGVSGLAPNKIANPYYRWETINKIEAALELGILKNRILLNASVYRNRTSNQLVGYSLPGITGFDNVIANLPAVIQNKGLEVDISSVNISRKDFSWTTSANISKPKNKLVAYPNIEASSYATQYAVGQPLTIRYLYKCSGIDLNTGLYTFVDLDKDGTLNSVKDAYPVFIGQKYFGGLDNNITYKGISLDFFFQFVKQTGFDFRGNATPGRFLISGANTLAAFIDRWQKTGDVAKYQRYAATSGDANTAFSNFLQSDGAIVDASFIRLKNVSLSWQLPEYLISSLNLKNARIYLQGQNLLTITHYKGIDPETQSYGVSPHLPTLRVITAGIQVSL